jgi:pimeloyl-ACP methyl ester carboxylesterase
MERITTPDGTTVSYDKYGSGPPLVLIHGSFSDHVTNWQACKSLLADRFTVYAMARRGRGESSVTTDHTLEDEMNDTVAMLRNVGAPAFLLGHSYGAVCSLGAAMREPETVAKLVLYEHPIENWVTRDVVQRLERLGQRDDWDGLVEAFMRHLEVPQQEIDEIKTTPFWSVWIVDAPSTLNDLRALVALRFNAEEYRVLPMPVALMIGSESPRRNYVTDALAAALPNAEILTLEGTAHEGMTMVPEQFVEKVSHFLLG